MVKNNELIYVPFNYKRQNANRNKKRSKVTLAEKLGISRPTLDKRLKLGNWKKGELAIIDLL